MRNLGTAKTLSSSILFSTIQLALNQSIQTVCIDEALGRRVARLSGLSVTGSIGILLRAKKEGHLLSIKDCIQKMLNHQIRLSHTKSA